MITILFDSRGDWADRQSHMHEFFSNNSQYNISPVSVFHDMVRYNKYNYLNNSEVLSSFWNVGSTRYTIEDINKFEEKYGFVNFWRIILNDRFIKNWKYEKIIEQVSFYIYAWESIFEKYKPQYVVSETVTGLWNFILYTIAKFYGAEYLAVLTTRNTAKYYYGRDLYGHWPQLEKLFIELSNKCLTENEQSETIKFISTFRQKQLVPPYMKSTIALPKMRKFINLPRFLINLYKDIVQNFFHRNYDYKLGYRISVYLIDIQRLVRIYYARLFRLFVNPDLEKKYVLFPVHYQPEATTDIWAPYYRDQIDTIRKIAMSMPFEYMLYVKEHSAALGTKSLKFYKEINKIPNVKLINPYFSISELIRSSIIVTVITGTSGLEAIFWNKPVIVFGNVFYDIYPSIFKVKNIVDLPDIIKSAASFSLKENDCQRLAFIYAYISQGYTSDIYKLKYTPEEIKKISLDLLSDISAI